MNLKKIFSIAIATCMLFTMSGLGVSAIENTDGAAGDQVVVQDDTDGNVDPAGDNENAGEGVVKDDESPSQTNEGKRIILVVAKSDYDSITLSWNAVEDVDSNDAYKIKKDGTELTDMTVSQSEDGKVCSAKVSGLEKAKVYTFEVYVPDAEYKGSVKAATLGMTLTGHEGYVSTKLAWDKIDGVNEYKVCRAPAGTTNWTEVTTVNTNNSPTPASSTMKSGWSINGEKIEYTDCQEGVTYFKDRRGYKQPYAKSTNNGGKNKVYDYMIKAVIPGDENNEAAVVESNVRKNLQPVRPITYGVTLKVTKTLKSHDGKNKSMTFKKGTRIYACGFTSGKYVFYKDGYIFYVMRIATKSQKCYYLSTNGKSYYEKVGSRDYSIETATEFVNDYCKDRKLGSSTSYFIWESFYTQHEYIFKKSGGAWVHVKNHEVATGKAYAPSSTGIDGHKNIWKKLSSRHGTKYWSCYSSYNALHGMPKKGKGRLGTPASTGCIRHDNERAGYIYKYIPKKTRVFNY